ncbi:MAG: hypothetical protein ACI909_003702 [Planctomycetota bacterium]|jgi:hypothetical protein
MQRQCEHLRNYKFPQVISYPAASEWDDNSFFVASQGESWCMDKPVTKLRN